MTPAGQDPASELEPEDRELARHLSEQRPVPKAGFRGALGRHLAARDPGHGPRPAQLEVMIAACTGGGAVLILLGTLVATGQL